MGGIRHGEEGAYIMTLGESLQWIADLFEEPAENIRPETKREEIAAWDSLGVLTLISGLDEKFGILLSESEISELMKVDNVLGILRRNGQLG